MLEQRVRQIINIYSEAKTAGASTTLNFIQVRPDTDIYDNDWPDGEPVCLNSQNKDCLIDGPGDGTVPLSSLKYLPADLSIEINMADHRKIVTKAQKEVIRYLTGHYPDKEYIGPWTAIKRLLFIRVYSPVDLQVIDPSGKKVGKDFSLNQEVNQIPGAFYSGFNTETEFITIINPQAGDYTVKLQGVANGEYKLGIDILDNNNQIQTKENLITGIISSSSQESFSFHYSSSSPTFWSATLKKEISFSDLIQDTKELY